MNRAIDNFDLEIRKKAAHDAQGTPFLVLINTVGDDMAQLATDLSTTEVFFFKRIV